MGFVEEPEPEYSGRQPVMVEEVTRYYLVPSDAGYRLPLYRQQRRQVVYVQTILAPVLILLSCLLLAGVAFVLWPSQPEVELEHWKLNHINFDTKDEPRSIFPVVFLNISLDVVLRIENPNFVGIYYDYLQVEIRYRGDYLGDAKLRGGHILARRVELVPAVLNLEAIKILANAAELLADVAKGEVPLTTHIKINGNVDLQAIRPHINVDVSCDVVVDPRTKLVIREYCGLDFLPHENQLQQNYTSAIAPSSVSQELMPSQTEVL
jgi:hypothetical protein